MTRFDGSCHCSRVTFEVLASPSHLVTCNCSICAAKGAVYLPVGEVSSVNIIAGESDLSAYRFNTLTATHFFCRHCGIHTFHRPRIDPSRWSVNARCLKDFDLTSLPVTGFEGRQWEVAARAEGWPG
jgi:hypothetical protein